MCVTVKIAMFEKLCTWARQRMAVIQQKQGTPCFSKNKKHTNIKIFYIKYSRQRIAVSKHKKFDN